jgi:HEPN domain-containing protein
MQMDSDHHSSPQDWLKRAKSNLIRAKGPKHEDVFWEDLCFDAQQAAEKALKALLLFHNIPFRFVHDIAELLTNLEQNGINLPNDIRATAELSNYSVQARYPGPIEPITKEEYQEAVKMAERVFSWVQEQISIDQ